MTYAIKAHIPNPHANTFEFTAQKTMYQGKLVAAGDTIFLFASENEGGQGLVARRIVTFAENTAKIQGVARQNPRVSLSIKRTALSNEPLGRTTLKAFNNWNDGQPATELNFKFYRQATNKIIRISDEAELFLDQFF